MTKNYTNTAFVLGGSVNSLGVVKALGRKGIQTIIVNNSDDTIAKFSRYTKFFKSPNPVNEKELYIDFLLDLQKSFASPPVLLPTSDLTVITISQYRDNLNKHFRFNIPNSKVVEEITSKDGFYQLALKHNLAVPKSFSVESSDEIRNIVEQLEFPCVIKPHYSHTWRTEVFRKKFGRMQIYEVKNPDELIDNYKIFSEYDNRMVVQESIQGSDDCEYSLHTYTSCDGQHMINFLAHKLRLEPIHFGSGAFIETAHHTEIFKTGNDFLKALDYRGMSSFQFKWDTFRKKFYAIELNPRYSLWNFLEPSCGVNYPFINYLDSLNLPFNIPPDYEDGVKWFSLERDISAFKAYRREGSLSFKDWIMSYRGRKYCAEFSWDDPLPFFGWAIPKISFFISNKIRRSRSEVKKEYKGSTDNDFVLTKKENPIP